MLAGPVDLHVFDVVDKMKVLGFLSVGGLLILDFRFYVPSWNLEYAGRARG